MTDKAAITRIQQEVIQAANQLVEVHSLLFENNVNERSITHKFAELLQPRFPRWDVDCEYNRNHDKLKTLNLPPRNDISSRDLDARTVFPDIIIHERGTDENHVVIEVKKSTNAESDDWDMAKLRAFKKELHYTVAIFFKFHTGTKTLGFEHWVV